MCKSVGSVVGTVGGAAIGGAIGGPAGAMIGMGIGGGIGSAFNKQPSVPGLSRAEKELLLKQGVTLDQMNEILAGETGAIEANRELLQQFTGLYNEDGTLNQGAVDQLKGKIMEQQALEEGISTDALQYLKNIFQPTGYQTQSGQIAQQELDRYQRALQGDIPLTEAQKRQEDQAFQKLKESAGQRGIMIEGDDVFTATSQSTAGNQLLSNLRSDVLSNRQSLGEAELQRGYQANMGRLGLGLDERGQLGSFAGNLVQAPGSAQLGFLNQSMATTPASLLPSYQGLQGGYGAATQPYQQQRYLGFQNQLARYGQQQQMWSDLAGLGTTFGMMNYMNNPRINSGGVARTQVSPYAIAGDLV